MANVFLRLPDDLKAEMEAAAASTGRSLNAWAIVALSEAVSLSQGGDDSRVLAQLSSLESRVLALESKVLAKPLQNDCIVQAKSLQGDSKVQSSPPIPEAVPTAIPEGIPGSTPTVQDGGDRLSDSALRKRWLKAGSTGTFQQWAAEQGWVRQGTGNRAIWQHSSQP